MPEDKPLNGLFDQLTAILPGKALADDAQKSAQALLQSALGRLDLVTREQFDAQAAVLARTRAKLDELERELKRLNEELDALQQQH